MNNKKELKCSFCGKAPSEHEVLVQGPTLELLCTSCARQIAESYGKYVKESMINAPTQQQKAEASKRSATPAAIKKYLDEYIIEQDSAKKILATAIYNHALRIKLKNLNVEDAEDIEKSNIIMVGPSGVGKTALIKRLAKAMDIPFVIEDITSFTSSGFVGRDLEGMLRDLVDAANGDIKRAEKGIIYIDEIDKCSRKGENPSMTSDPSHESLQQAMLKMLEGSEVEVSSRKGERHHPNAPAFKINTQNILFIVGGAFEGIDKIVARRQKKGNASIGFGSKMVLDEDKAMNDYLADVRTEDLKKFGILPELLGRLPIICTLQALSRDSLVRILNEPKNSLLKQYEMLFKANDIELIFSRAAVLYIADQAIKRGTGARSLRGIVEGILTDVMYEAPSEPLLSKVIVNVEDNKIKIEKRYCNEEEYAI